jgi:hypothetical protein
VVVAAAILMRPHIDQNQCSRPARQRTRNHHQPIHRSCRHQPCCTSHSSTHLVLPDRLHRDTKNQPRVGPDSSARCRHSNHSIRMFDRMSSPRTMSRPHCTVRTDCWYSRLRNKAPIPHHRYHSRTILYKAHHILLIHHTNLIVAATKRAQLQWRRALQD